VVSLYLQTHEKFIGGPHALLHFLRLRGSFYRNRSDYLNTKGNILVISDKKIKVHPDIIKNKFEINFKNQLIHVYQGNKNK
jgi:hypothetical protein